MRESDVLTLVRAHAVPVDPEDASRVTEGVVPDEVPVAAQEQQAVRGDVTIRRLTAIDPVVAEADPLAGLEGVVEDP